MNDNDVPHSIEAHNEEESLPVVASLSPPWDHAAAVGLFFLSAVVLLIAVIILIGAVLSVIEGTVPWIDVLLFIGIPFLPLLIGLMLLKSARKSMNWIRSGRPQPELKDKNVQ